MDRILRALNQVEAPTIQAIKVPKDLHCCLERDIPLRGYPIGIEGDALSGISLRTDAYIMHMYG